MTHRAVVAPFASTPRFPQGSQSELAAHVRAISKIVATWCDRDSLKPYFLSQNRHRGAFRSIRQKIRTCKRRKDESPRKKIHESIF